MESLEKETDLDQLDGTSIHDRLHEAAAAGDKTIVLKLLKAGADPNYIPNMYGMWTSLHVACANNRPEVVRLLIENRANVLALDRKKYTPLHYASSYGYMECLEAFETDFESLQVDESDRYSLLGLAAKNEKLEAVKYLLCKLKVNPKGIGDTLLELCCYKGDLDFAKQLINEFRCEPKKAKDAVFQLCCEKGDLEMAKCMVTQHSCIPKADNLVSACEKGHSDIVSYLLADLHCDPNEGNSFRITPLTRAKDKKVIQLLLRHGAVAKDAYVHHRQSLGLVTSKDPLKNPVKMFVMGYGGEGKSTLVEAMQHEKLRRFTAPKAVTGVSQQTAGIVPKVFDSAVYGCVQFFDCAGQETFHSSHASVIRTSVVSTPPVFILVVGLHRDDDKTKHSVGYWLDIIVNQCARMEGKAPLIVVGSHADQVSQDDIRRKTKIIYSIAEKYLQLHFSKFVSMDCRYPLSDGMKSLREAVGKACTTLRSKLSVSLNSHMFLIYLLDKHQKENFTTIMSIQLELEERSQEKKKDKSNLMFIPTETPRLVEICTQLSDKGHILFLHNSEQPKKSFVIIDSSVLMTEVNGTIFAPVNFEEHCEVATSTGIVPKSRLVDHFSGSSIEMIVGFLSHHELAVPITDKEVLALIKKQLNDLGEVESPDETYLFCPALIRLEAADEIWNEALSENEYRFGWTIFCKRDQYFQIKLFQVLLLRLALSLKLAIRIDDSIPSLQQYCSVWKTGVHWLTNDSISVIVQLDKTSKSITLLMRAQEVSVEFMLLRSEIVSKIRKAALELCPFVKVSESIFHPSELASYPLKPFTQLKLFSLNHLAECIVHCKKDIPLLYHSIAIHKLLQVEVYVDLGENLLCALFNETQQMYNDKVSDQFFDAIISKWGQQPDTLTKVIPAFTRAIITQQNVTSRMALNAWRDNTNGEYKYLRNVLDKLSVFAGKNLLELAGVEMKAFSNELLLKEVTPNQTTCTKTEVSPRPTQLSLSTPPTPHGGQTSRPDFNPRSPTSTGSMRLPSVPEGVVSSVISEDEWLTSPFNSISTMSSSQLSFVSAAEYDQALSDRLIHVMQGSEVTERDKIPASNRSNSLPVNSLYRERADHSRYSFMQQRSSSCSAAVPDQPPPTPCPDDSTLIKEAKRTGHLNIDYLKLLCVRLWDVRLKWFLLGIQLNIDDTTLKVIERNHSKYVDECFQEMLATFLKLRPSPKVSDLIEALKSKPVDHESLIEKIKDLLPEDHVVEELI